MEIIIEELSRNGKVIRTHRYNEQTVRIGRGYQNHLILQDPHVEAQHLELTCVEGRWYIRDTHSKNGTFYKSGQPLESCHLLSSGEVFILGKTTLRLVEPNHPVAATQLLSEHEGWINKLAHPMSAGAILIVSILFAAFMQWLQSPTTVKIEDIVSRSLGLGLLGLAWPLFFAGLSKIFKHEARFFSQVSLSFIFIMLHFSWAFAAQVIYFNIAQQWIHSALDYFIDFWMISGLIWLSLTIGFNHRKRVRWAIAASVALGLTGFAILQDSRDPFDHMSKLEYNARLVAPMYQWRDESSLDNYLQRAEDLFVQTAIAAHPSNVHQNGNQSTEQEPQSLQSIDQDADTPKNPVTQ
jgi:pSer/pThr/pTyr-binding forkhead associated (FHA) protein